MTVKMDQMKSTVLKSQLSAKKMKCNVEKRGNAYQLVGNATESQIVQGKKMKIIAANTTAKIGNLLVRMGIAYSRPGDVMAMKIVQMVRMS